MRIAITTKLSQEIYPAEKDVFLYETFRRITEIHPEHDFLFIFNKHPDDRFIFSPNVKAVVAGPEVKFPLVWRIWYNLKVPAILKNYQADVFVSGDGICSLATPVPQCLVIPDLAFLHCPGRVKKSKQAFYKKYTPRFLQIAKRIATLSAFLKIDIVQHFPIEAGKIDIVFSGVNDVFRPATEIEKERIKNSYTGGKEYFVYASDLQQQVNLVQLLKAFSVFKKRQQTGMKLVLTGRSASRDISFIKSLASYKYRNDVVITGTVDENELARIIGTGYGFVYPVAGDGFGMPVLQALTCGVPVITTGHSAMEEIAGDAALYADTKNYKELAEKMMLVYKDELLRKTMIAKGHKAALNYNWQITADLLWKCIEKAMEKE